MNAAEHKSIRRFVVEVDTKWYMARIAPTAEASTELVLSQVWCWRATQFPGFQVEASSACLRFWRRQLVEIGGTFCAIRTHLREEINGATRCDSFLQSMLEFDTFCESRCLKCNLMVASPREAAPVATPSLPLSRLAALAQPCDPALANWRWCSPPWASRSRRRSTWTCQMNTAILGTSWAEVNSQRDEI